VTRVLPIRRHAAIVTVKTGGHMAQKWNMAGGAPPAIFILASAWPRVRCSIAELFQAKPRKSHDSLRPVPEDLQKML